MFQVPPARSLFILLMLAASTLLAAPRALAETVEIVAPNGTAGADGAAGADGGDGGDGADAAAVSNAPHRVNEAEAIAGDGGDAGDGGAGPPSGGAGGDGGFAGNATAQASVSIASTPSLPGDANAIATAGDGGDAGLGGLGGTPGAPGAARDGGDAVATAAAYGFGATRVEAEARATGGRGGAGRQGATPGRGGSASATASAISEGAAAEARAFITGGAGGGGTDGSAGLDGEDAIVDGAVSGSSPSLLTLRVTVHAGRGGNSLLAGGDGGDAHVSGDAYNPGGGAISYHAQVSGGDPGGNGRGGDATIGTIAVNSSDPTQHVSGNVLGFGGDRTTGTAGNGGDAILVNGLTTSATGDIFFAQQADGGFGAQRGAAHSELTNSVDASSIRSLASAEGSTSTAIADVTNASGDATAEAFAESGSRNEAHATAASRGYGDATASATTDPTSTGDEIATASATADGNGAVIAEALTEGGVANAFGAGASGTVDVRAEGDQPTARGVSATGDVHVSVSTAIPVPLSAIAIRDAVSGGTAGHLSLSQRVLTNVGSATTSLDAENEGGGSLEVDVLARGGSGGGNAVLGDIHATSTTGADVTLLVTGRGGANSGAAPGRVLQLDPLDPSAPSTIRAESNGGRVRVETHFETGALSNGATGEDLSVENVALVETTGAVEIDQEAIAGRGGSSSAGSGTPYDAGDGGAAISRLTRVDERASLSLASRAVGGGGGMGLAGRTAGDGGRADAVVETSNAGGRIAALAQSRGGAVQGAGFSAAGRGGDGYVDILASSTGDGHSVEVGVGDALTTGAFGGDGVATNSTSASALRGHGGDAFGHSVGTAFGESPVTVIDRATGGRGGGSTQPAGRFGTGGNGGHGTSHAFAQGAGSSAVSALSQAIGGTASDGPNVRGLGGNARSDAEAIGLGAVDATALSAAGDGRLGGSAHATARARGATGFAAADATGGGSGVNSVHSGTDYRAATATTIGGASQASVSADAGYQLALPDLVLSQDVASQAFLTASPLSEDVDAARAGNVELAQATGPSQVRALGFFSSSSPSGSTTTQAELDILLGPADILFAAAIGVFSLEASGSAFSEMRFRVERSGTAVLDQVFASLAAAELYFSDQLYPLSTLGGTSTLRIFVETTQAEGDAVAFGLGITAIPVPEPGTGLLLTLALVASGARTRTRRPSQAAR